MKQEVIVGIDEVGRGPLAGPVCIGAYVVAISDLDIFAKTTQTIKDSKKLSEKKRNEWTHVLLKNPNSHIIIAEKSADQIDELGISVCLKTCVGEALEEISKTYTITKVFLDGSLHAPEKYLQETIIKGDESHPIISGASIFAKQYRDTKMKELAKEYPEYGFENHVGYGTRQHYAAIEEYGIISTIHRISFLKKLLQ